MSSAAAGLPVLDRARPAARPRSVILRRIVFVAILAGAGALTAFVASRGHSSSTAPLAPGRHALSALPLAAQPAVSRGLGADQSAFFARRAPAGAVSLRNAPQGLHATLSSGAIALSGAHGLRLGLSAPALGRGGALVAVSGLTAASVDRNRVAFSAAGVSEWFANGPLGVEQGFTLARRPAGSGALTISQTVSGNTRAHLERGGGGVTFRSSDGALSYRQLVVSDAAGARVAASLGLAGNRLTITIEDRHAVYPLRVDPTLQQTAEFTASDGVAADEFGTSAAVSGSTIVVGAPYHTVGSNGDQGAVYVFTQPPSGGWADATQTAELTASDGNVSDYFGLSVAISGSTIVVGAPYANSYQGGAYVYTEPAGGWSGSTANPMTQTAELSASNGGTNRNFGDSVAVSGATVVVGTPYQTVGANTSQGAVYEYTMPVGGWVGTTANPMTQNAELTASDGAGGDTLGTAVAVSGSTIVAGSRGHNGIGAAYEYTEPAGGWAGSTSSPLTQTAELAPTDGVLNDVFGSAVAVSGSTIAVGAPAHNNGQGAVYVYSEPAAGWSGTTVNPMPQTAELSASDGAGAGGVFFGGDYLGSSVAVSSSGSTIIAGAPYHAVGSNAEQGAAYMFSEPAGGWVSETETAELTASDGAGGDDLGVAVGISGSEIVAAAPLRSVNANANQGAAYAFEDPVTASTVSLSLGPWTRNADGSWTAIATFTVDDANGNPVTGDQITFASSGNQTIGPVTPGSAPGTYQATITSPGGAPGATISATDESVAPPASATAQLSTTPTATATTPTTTGVGGLPANGFVIDSHSDARNGAITLTLDLPGPGSVTALGTHSDPPGDANTASLLPSPGRHRFAWAPRLESVAAAAGKMRIRLEPNAAGERMLRYARGAGWALHIRIWITYTPTGGYARTLRTTIRVLAPRRG
jgi:hypothetical protein